MLLVRGVQSRWLEVPKSLILLAQPTKKWWSICAYEAEEARCLMKKEEQ